MKVNKILIVGCSFSSGCGMPGEHSNPHIWANQLSKKLGATTVKNAAKTGANNHWIFLETISELIKDQYDLVLVEWSAIPRYKFKVGLELYPVDTLLNNNIELDNIDLVGQKTVSKKWLSVIKDHLLKIHNDHWDILDLVKYINVLIELQTRSRRGQIYFINGLGPWPDQYFVKKQIGLPSELDGFTRNLLQVDHRDDAEIFQLYDMIHQDYTAYGGIQQDHWLNLYQSQNNLKVDTISAIDLHPGYASQDIFTEYFYQQLEEKLTLK